MKKTLIVLAHPNMQESIVNKALIETIKSENKVTMHDLYATYTTVENIDVAQEQELLLAHDRIIFQFPLYWFSSPAILKEWLDKVFEYGFAYGHEGTKLVGKEAQIVISAGSPVAEYSAEGYNRFTLEEYLLPLKASILYTGMEFKGIFAVGGALGITPEALAQGAADYKNFILNS